MEEEKCKGEVEDEPRATDKSVEVVHAEQVDVSLSVYEEGNGDALCRRRDHPTDRDDPTPYGVNGSKPDLLRRPESNLLAPTPD